MKNNPFEKKRTILNENPHTVTKRVGNIYELMHGDSITYRPRFGIKP